MIIFLYGPDTFRSRRKLKELKEKFISQVDKSGLNLETLRGAKLELPDFERAVSTPAFLAKKRMIIIEDLLADNKGTKLAKEILEIIKKNPLENTILIFWDNIDLNVKEKKISGKQSNPLLNHLKKEKLAQHFVYLAQSEVYRFISSEVKAKNGKISPPAVRLLGDIVGNDLWRLDSEIEKLLAFSKNAEITVDSINELVKGKLDEDIFKLTDALGQKNKKLALKLISDQLKLGTSPLELLSKIIWQFKNLILIKSFTEKNGGGYNDQRLGFQVGLHPFVAKKTLAQISHHDLKNLKRTFKRLLDIDYKIKTSQADPEVLFDLLVIKS